MFHRLKYWLLSLAILLCAVPSHAQFTAVTAQVKDSNSAPYANCSGSANFVPAQTATTVPLIGGSAFTTVVPFNCDANGNISLTLVDNNQVSDGHTTGTASQWRFAIESQSICFAGQKFGFSSTITITGTTQDITSTLTSSAIVLPTCSGTGIIPISGGGTGTGAVLTGVVRGGNPFTAAELSGDAVTSGSNSVTVGALHFGATALSLGTAPSSGQFLLNSGGTITGATASAGSTVYNTITTSNATGATTNAIGSTTMIASAPTNQNYLLNVYVQYVAGTAGCGSQPTWAMSLSWTDPISNAGFGITPGWVADTLPGIIVTGPVNFATAGTGVVYTSSYPIFFRAKSGTSISYSVSVTQGSGCSTGASYAVVPNLSQL